MAEMVEVGEGTKAIIINGRKNSRSIRKKKVEAFEKIVMPIPTYAFSMTIFCI